MKLGCDRILGSQGSHACQFVNEVVRGEATIMKEAGALRVGREILLH